MDYQSMTDEAILNEIGHRLRRHRLNQNITQVALAKRVGISRKALRNAESGADCTLSTMLRLTRGLGLLNQLEAFLPDPGVSPLQMADLQGRERQRATGSRRKSQEA